MRTSTGLIFADEPVGVVNKDSRGRLPLGFVATGSRYRVNKATTGEILLTPVVEIPAREMWMWENPEVLEDIRQGLADAAVGDTVPLSAIERDDSTED
ncbi:MAG TPA: hypothetical protein VGN26_16965 [Armatimonadota bacterium]